MFIFSQSRFWGLFFILLSPSGLVFGAPQGVPDFIQKRLDQGQWQEAIWQLEDLQDSAWDLLIEKLKQELLNRVKSGRVKGVPRVLEGSSNSARKVDFENGLSIVFKVDHPDDPESKNEVLAYRLSELLKFSVVPMTTVLELNLDEKPRVGSGQVWIHEGQSGKVANKRLVSRLPSYVKMEILDRVLENGDRQAKNWLFLPADERVVALDHGLLFVSSPHLLSDELIREFFGKNPFLARNLLSLDSDRVRAELGSWVGGDQLRTVLAKLGSLRRLVR